MALHASGTTVYLPTRSHRRLSNIHPRVFRLRPLTADCYLRRQTADE